MYKGSSHSSKANTLLTVDLKLRAISSLILMARQHNKAQFDKAMSLFKEGMRPYPVAREININPSTCCEWFKKYKKGQNRIQKKNDHTGAVYGEWTVIKELDRVPQYGYKGQQGETIPQWQVKCSCGLITTKTGKNLSEFKKKQELIDKGKGSEKWRMHCNNHPMHLMPCSIGDILGDLEVVCFPRTNESSRKKYKTYKGKELKGDYSKRGKYWIGCLCHACKKYTIDTPYVITKKEWRERKERLEINPKAVCACGCNRSVTHGMSRPQESGHNESIYYSLWQSTKASAKNKNLNFNLTPQYLEALGIPKKCPVLGIDLIRPSPGEGRTWNTPSVDKFYPKLGYIKGNVQIISWRANHLKSDGTPEEWENVAKWSKNEDIKKRLEGMHPDQQKK